MTTASSRGDFFPQTALNHLREIGRRSAGVSVGPRGAKLSAGTRGVGATVSLLGTGLAYVWRKRR
ncbi:MAG: DUF4236 domain-containing protein [Actinobacteria bacterium]|nr:DUF4236 domain-containing protein [Actinomycetota bacterium]